MVGPSGEILLVNPPFCAMTRRLESELVGLDIRSLLRPLAPEDAFTTLTPQPGTPVATTRARLVTAAGETIPVEVLSIPTPDETAGKAGWSTITLRDRRHEDAREAREQALQRDADETGRQLEALQHSVREGDVVRARFWTAAAHELRTPLAIAQSYLEVVLSDLAEDLPERPTQLLKTASESLTRLERLIADVLDAAVSGRARSTLRLAELDLAEVLRGLAPALSAAAFKRGLRLSVEVPKGLPKVPGDREKVERLVTNLVDHSLRRVPRGGPEVRLLASAADGRAFVRVVDRAPTLTPEKAAHLYDDVGSARGAGEFGLSVARRLADAMAAELTAHADPDGSNVKSVAWTLPAPGRGRAECVTDGSARAWRRLARREDVALAASCAHPRERVRAVGGSVRDAFLGRAGGDLDLTAAPGSAAPFAATPRGARRHARRRRRSGAPANPQGSLPRARDRRVGGRGRTGRRPPAPRLHRQRARVRTPRRSARCARPARWKTFERTMLRAPRPGVFLEDPLRVLRAARFLAQLPGFRVARSAEAEIEAAGRFLRKVSEERRLVEMDKLLGARRRRAVDRALRFLERVGALQTLIQSSAPRTRRGIALVARLEGSDPRVARALLLFPLGPKRAEDLLRRWKTSREEQRLASRLLALPLRRKGRGPPRGARLRSCCGFLPLSKKNLSLSPRRGRRARRATWRARPGASRAARPRSAGSSSPSALFHSKKSEAPSPSPRARIWGGRSASSISPSPPARSAAPGPPGRGSRRAPELENARPGWYPKASLSRTSKRWT